MQHFIKKIALSGLVAMSILPLAGCWDSNEPEKLVYANGIGVDYKDGKYILYFQLINFSLLAKSESSNNSGDAKVAIGKASGKNLDEAAFNLYKSSQRKIFLGHLSYLVFSEEAIKQGAIKPTIDLLDRYRETRYRIWTYATKEPISKVILVIPLTELSTSQSSLSEPKSTYQQSSYIHPIDLRELIIFFDEPSHEASIPTITVTEKNWKTDIGKHASIKLEGAAVVTPDTLKGKLLGNNANGLSYFSESFFRKEINANEKEFPQTSMIVNKVKVKIRPEVKGGNAFFHIDVKARAALQQTIEPVNLPKLTKEMERILAKQITTTYEKGLKMDADIFRLSEVLYRKNVKAWKKIEKNGKVPLTKDSIRITVKGTIMHGNKQRNLPTLE